MSNANWSELIEKKEEFQEILKLLVAFDEKTGRFRRYGDPETHYMRQALSVADPSDLRIFVRALGDFVYQVVVELNGPGGQLVSTWIHEDGIRAERDEFSENREHPVHTLTCLTDLYEGAGCPLDGDVAALALQESTLAFLIGEGRVDAR